MTPEQAKRALDTLQDDQKRAQMIETLRTIANASPQAQTTPSATEKPSAIPLSADSLGAQLLATVSDQIGEISREVASAAHTLTHFKAFYWWFIRTANDPEAYGQLLDIAVFSKLRRGAWWRGPLLAPLLGSAVDTLIFFSLAFSPLFAGLDLWFGRPDGSLAFPAPLLGVGMMVPLWLSLAAGDFSVKFLAAGILLAPYRALMGPMPQPQVA